MQRPGSACQVSNDLEARRVAGWVTDRAARILLPAEQFQMYRFEASRTSVESTHPGAAFMELIGEVTAG
jgi:hypothetical protein